MAIKDLVPRFRRQNAVQRRQGDDPAEGLLSLHQEINRMFDDFFRGFDLAPWGDSGSGGFLPAVDITETDREVTVKAELPGMDEKDVSVEVDDNTLTIRGERKDEHEEKNRRWHCRESYYGSFHRVLPLPGGVDGEKAKARFKKGVLTVTMPKLPEEKSNRRAINIETG